MCQETNPLGPPRSSAKISLVRTVSANLLTLFKFRFLSRTTRATGANWMMADSSSSLIFIRCGILGRPQWVEARTRRQVRTHG